MSRNTLDEFAKYIVMAHVRAALQGRGMVHNYIDKEAFDRSQALRIRIALADLGIGRLDR